MVKLVVRLVAALAFAMLVASFAEVRDAAAAGAAPPPAAGAAPPAAAPPAAGAPPPAAEPPAPVEVAPDSPRASMTRFAELSEKGDWAEAARYLDLPPENKERGPELAKRLHEVLFHGLLVDFDELSPKSKGEIGANQPPPSSIELGTIEEEGAPPVPIKIERREATSKYGPRWVFSKHTVAQVDRLHAQLERGWARAHLPAPLLLRGPKGLYLWQWIAVPLVGLVCSLVGLALAWITGLFVRRVLVRKARTGRLLARFRRPLALGWSVAALWFVVPLLELTLRAEELIRGLLGALAYLAFFWAVFRVFNGIGEELSESNWAATRPTARTLGMMGLRFGKAIVGALAFMAALSQLGYSPTSILAGLGLGGIAVALAAQNTVEHLFGSIAILVDQPFRVGDRIRFGETEGVVEAIGLRSTRLRTLERSLVIVPNGTLADAQVESLTARDASRFGAHLGIALVPMPTAAKLVELTNRLEGAFADHAMVRADSPFVTLRTLGESSLDITAVAVIETTSIEDFLRAQHELLLVCMTVVAEVGLALASPVRTLAMPGVGEKARGEDA